MWFLLRESQCLFTEVLDFSLVVEGFKGGEVDALEDGAQGLFLAALFLLGVDNQRNALIERSFAMVVGFEFHDDRILGKSSVFPQNESLNTIKKSVSVFGYEA